MKLEIHFKDGRSANMTVSDDALGLKLQTAIEKSNRWFGQKTFVIQGGGDLFVFQLREVTCFRISPIA